MNDEPVPYLPTHIVFAERGDVFRDAPYRDVTGFIVRHALPVPSYIGSSCLEPDHVAAVDVDRLAVDKIARRGRQQQ